MDCAKTRQESREFDDAQRLNGTDVQLTAKHPTEAGYRVAARIDRGEAGSSGR